MKLLNNMTKQDLIDILSLASEKPEVRSISFTNQYIRVEASWLTDAREKRIIRYLLNGWSNYFPIESDFAKCTLDLSEFKDMIRQIGDQNV